MNIELTVIDHPMPGHNVDDRVIVDDLGHKVAVVLPGLSSSERDQMAALFAAAPDMYRVCKLYADALEQVALREDRDIAAFRKRWEIPVDMSVETYCNQQVSAALRKAVPQ